MRISKTTTVHAPPTVHSLAARVKGGPVRGRSSYRRTNYRRTNYWRTNYRRLMLSLLAVTLFSVMPTGAVAQEITTSPTPSTADGKSIPKLPGYEITFPALGTQVELKAFHHDPAIVQRAFAEAQQRVVELEAILTDYDATSETRQLSTRARSQYVSVSDPLWHLLVASDRWHQLSHGAFDASLGQLTQLWRRYRRTPRHPSTDELDWALRHCGWHQVGLDTDQRRVQFAGDDLRLDFGAIGKGFIVDQAFAVLAQQGLTCTLVNISGNMRAGEPPPQRPGWRIEIAPLERGGRPLRQIHLAHASIATSGDLWQFVMIDGVRRSHIIDPRTGVGVAGPLSATAISPTATDADALATTACIIGFERGQQVARTIPATELLLAKKLSSDPVQAGDKPTPSPTAQLVHVQTTVGFPDSL